MSISQTQLYHLLAGIYHRWYLIFWIYHKWPEVKCVQLTNLLLTWADEGGKIHLQRWEDGQAIRKCTVHPMHPMHHIQLACDLSWWGWEGTFTSIFTLYLLVFVIIFSICHLYFMTNIKVRNMKKKKTHQGTLLQDTNLLLT